MSTTPSTEKKRIASMKTFHGSQHQNKHEFKIGDEFSDVTIKVGKSSIRSHKYVLKQASAYYKRMFTHSLQENNTGFLVHEAVHEGTMKSIIEMAYSNQLKVDIDNVQDVSVTADY